MPPRKVKASAKPPAARKARGKNATAAPSDKSTKPRPKTTKKDTGKGTTSRSGKTTKNTTKDGDPTAPSAQRDQPRKEGQEPSSPSNSSDSSLSSLSDSNSGNSSQDPKPSDDNGDQNSGNNGQTRPPVSPNAPPGEDARARRVRKREEAKSRALPSRNGQQPSRNSSDGTSGSRKRANEDGQAAGTGGLPMKKARGAGEPDQQNGDGQQVTTNQDDGNKDVADLHRGGTGDSAGPAQPNRAATEHSHPEPGSQPEKALPKRPEPIQVRNENMGKSAERQGDVDPTALVPPRAISIPNNQIVDQHQVDRTSILRGPGQAPYGLDVPVDIDGDGMAWPNANKPEEVDRPPTPPPWRPSFHGRIKSTSTGDASSHRSEYGRWFIYIGGSYFIGAGKQGQVVGAFREGDSPNQQFAVKITSRIIRHTGPATERYLNPHVEPDNFGIVKLDLSREEQARNEIRTFRHLQHRHIVQYIAHTRTDEQYFLFMELMGGTLNDLVKDKRGQLFDTFSTEPTPEKWRKKTSLLWTAFVHTLRGLEHVHASGHVHHDINFDNIQWTHQNDKPVFKIADFGFARSTRTKAQYIGSPNLIPPELCYPAAPAETRDKEDDGSDEDSVDDGSDEDSVDDGSDENSVDDGAWPFDRQGVNGLFHEASDAWTTFVAFYEAMKRPITTMDPSGDDEIAVDWLHDFFEPGISNNYSEKVRPPVEVVDDEAVNDIRQDYYHHLRDQIEHQVRVDCLALADFRKMAAINPLERMSVLDALDLINDGNHGWDGWVPEWFLVSQETGALQETAEDHVPS